LASNRFIRSGQGAGELGAVTNRAIVDAVEQYADRFLGFLGVDLNAIDESLAEIRDHAGPPNIKGISIEPGSGTVPRFADDPVLDPLYAAAIELDLPVSISLSGLLSPLAGHDITWASPIPVQRLARRFPELKIIVSHGAWPYAQEMIVVGLACPNVYVSPDLYAVTPGMIGADIYVKGANMFLGERTLFGSAYPTRDLEECARDFMQMGWREDIVPNVLWNNAAKLLKLDR
jgi:predicted TIM-barrel fold metal-dependent hydrolase